MNSTNITEEANLTELQFEYDVSPFVDLTQPTLQEVSFLAPIHWTYDDPENDFVLNISYSRASDPGNWVLIKSMDETEPCGSCVLNWDVTWLPEDDYTIRAEIEDNYSKDTDLAPGILTIQHGGSSQIWDAPVKMTPTENYVIETLHRDFEGFGFDEIELRALTPSGDNPVMKWTNGSGGFFEVVADPENRVMLDGDNSYSIQDDRNVSLFWKFQPTWNWPEEDLSWYTNATFGPTQDESPLMASNFTNTIEIHDLKITAVNRSTLLDNGTWLKGGELIQFEGSVNFSTISQIPPDSDYTIRANYSVECPSEQNCNFPDGFNTTQATDGNFSLTLEVPLVPNGTGSFRVELVNIAGTGSDGSHPWAVQRNVTIDTLYPTMLNYSQLGPLLEVMSNRPFRVNLSDDESGMAEPKLMHWVEGRDDNGDGIPQFEEYQVMSPQEHSGKLWMWTLNDSANVLDERVSIYLNSTDYVGNQLPQGPGFENDLVTYETTSEQELFINEVVLSRTIVHPTIPWNISVNLSDLNGFVEVGGVELGLGGDLKITFADGLFVSNDPNLVVDESASDLVFQDPRGKNVTLYFEFTMGWDIPIVEYSADLSLSIQADATNGTIVLKTLSSSWKFAPQLLLSSSLVDIEGPIQGPVDSNWVASGDMLEICGNLTFEATGNVPAVARLKLTGDRQVDVENGTFCIQQKASEEEGTKIWQIDFISNPSFFQPLGTFFVNIDSTSPTGRILDREEVRLSQLADFELLIAISDDNTLHDARLHYEVIRGNSVVNNGTESIAFNENGFDEGLPLDMSEAQIQHADTLNVWLEATDLAGNGGTIGDSASPLQSIQIVDDLVDLALEDFQVTPSNPTTGEVVLVQVNVTNQGTRFIDVIFDLNFTVNFGEFSEVQRLTLVAGQSFLTVTFNWTAKTGVQNLSLVVDEQREVFEIDEGNNLFQFDQIVNPLPSSFSFNTQAMVAGGGIFLLLGIGILLFLRRFVGTHVTDYFRNTITGYDGSEGTSYGGEMTSYYGNDDTFDYTTVGGEAPYLQENYHSEVGSQLPSPPIEYKDGEQTYQVQSEASGWEDFDLNLLDSRIENPIDRK